MHSEKDRAPWPPRQPVASIIIPTYRREAPLRQTLACIELLQTPGLEVIVVDQTPEHEPETTALLQRLAAARRIIYLPIGQRGLVRARNLALSITRAPIVIFIDDDVTFAPDFVAAHLGSFADPDVLASAGRVHLRRYAPDEPLPPVEPPATSPEWFDMPAPLASVATVRGCNMAFRRATIEALGRFDERLTLRSEDEDLAFGVRALGGRVRFTPQAWVIHQQEAGGIRGQRDAPQTLNAYYHDMAYFSLKNLSLESGLRHLTRTYLDSIVSWQALRMGPAEILRRHRALLLGSAHGWRSWRAAGSPRRGLSYRV